MKKVISPDNGVDTSDGDPTDMIRGIVSKIANQQGGTETENTPDSASRRKQQDDGGIDEPLNAPAPRSDYGEFYTQGEYEDRNFGPEDNVSTDNDGGDNRPYGSFSV